MLKGLVSRDDKMADMLKKFSKLFTKVAMAKAATAKVKEQQNYLKTHPNVQTHPNSHQAVPLTRVVDTPPIPASPFPRVPVTSEEAECHVRGVGKSVQSVEMAS